MHRFYNMLKVSVPKDCSLIYVDDFETIKAHSFEKINERFLHEYELYLKTVAKQDEYLHLYRVGIKRDDKDWMENIANKVGLTLPKLNQSLHNK